MVELKDILSVIDLQNALPEDKLNLIIHKVAPLDRAQSGELSFLSSSKFRRQLSQTQASVVLLAEKDKEHCPEGTLALVVPDPYLAYAHVSHLFDQTPSLHGVDPSAYIHPEAQLGNNVAVGPKAVIQKGVVLGDGVEIGAGAVLGESASIGAHTRICANVTIAHRCQIGEQCLIQSGTVIGANGFGYAPNRERWQSIAQLGRVTIGDRVEIGANCAIDRGAVDDTVIESDVIIDNLVQIAHNVKLGQSTAIAAQVGIAGSAIVGENCTFGGQAGVAGHITIAAGSHFTGQAMITKGTTESGLYSSGIPASTNREWRKMVARLRKLESMQNRLSELEKKLEQEGKE